NGTGGSSQLISKGFVQGAPSQEITERNSSLIASSETFLGNEGSQQLLKRSRTSNSPSPVAQKWHSERKLENGGAAYFTGSLTRTSPISPPQPRYKATARLHGRTHSGTTAKSDTSSGSGSVMRARVPQYDQHTTQNWPSGRLPPTAPKSMRSASTGLAYKSSGAQRTVDGTHCTVASSDRSKTFNPYREGSRPKSPERTSSGIHGSTGLPPRPAVKEPGAVIEVLNANGNVATAACSPSYIQTSLQSHQYVVDDSKSINSEGTTSSGRSLSAVSLMALSSKIRKCHSCHKPRMTDNDPPWVRCYDCKRRNHPSCCNPPLAEIDAAGNQDFASWRCAKCIRRMPETLSPALRISPHGSSPLESEHRPSKRQKFDGSAGSGFTFAPRSWGQNAEPYGDEHRLHDKADPCQSTAASGQSYGNTIILLSEPPSQKQIPMATDEIPGLIPHSVAQTSSLCPVSETHTQDSTPTHSSVLPQPSVLGFTGFEPVRAVSNIDTIYARSHEQVRENGTGTSAKDQSHTLSHGKQAQGALYQPPSQSSQIPAETSATTAHHMIPRGVAAYSRPEQPKNGTESSTSPSFGSTMTKHAAFRCPLLDLHQIASEDEKSMSIDSKISEGSIQSTPLGDLGNLNLDDISSQQRSKVLAEAASSTAPAMREHTDLNGSTEQRPSNRTVQALFKNTDGVQTPEISNKNADREIFHFLVPQPPIKLGSMDTGDCRHSSQSCSPSLPDTGAQSSTISPIQAARAGNEIDTTLPSPNMMRKDNAVMFALCTNCGIKRVFGTARNGGTEVLCKTCTNGKKCVVPTAQSYDSPTTGSVTLQIPETPALTRTVPQSVPNKLSNLDTARKAPLFPDSGNGENSKLRHWPFGPKLKNSCVMPKSRSSSRPVQVEGSPAKPRRNELSLSQTSGTKDISSHPPDAPFKHQVPSSAILSAKSHNPELFLKTQKALGSAQLNGKAIISKRRPLGYAKTIDDLKGELQDSKDQATRREEGHRQVLKSKDQALQEVNTKLKALEHQNQRALETKEKELQQAKTELLLLKDESAKARQSKAIEIQGAYDEVA
ncbi:MAG: hypothetical protein M1830_002530, partial [Pleopsidium flavum]